MELGESRLQYLLAITQLQQGRDCGVGCSELSALLHRSKASVSRMIDSLMELGLLERKPYGKIFLTDEGMRLAAELRRCVAELQRRIPQMGLVLPAGDVERLAVTMAAALSETGRNCVLKVTAAEKTR